MRQRGRESSTDVGLHDDFDDEHDDLFFDSEDDDGYDQHGLPTTGGSRSSRLESRRRARKRRRRSLFAFLTVFVVAVVVAAILLVGLPLYHHFSPDDYSGDGSGSVVVTVHANDGAAQIGATLEAAGVVASERAFTNAAENNDRSRSIQPGSYRLHEHMSGSSAVRRLLDPAARINSDVLVTEGATTFDVASRLSAAPCDASSRSGTVCGLGLSTGAVGKAFANVRALGLPTEFTRGGTPRSVEGFLYPATYPFDKTTTALSALQTMVSQFTDHARSTDFTSRATALKLTPYQELIIASIIQSEAKYPADMAKVARVILNRLAAKMPLQVDASTIYGAKVKGIQSTVDNAHFETPYNTYLHDGLPPTPISNPGAAALNAAAHPAVGNWKYYVNSSPDRLFFTNSEQAFETARQKCVANNWGCG